MQMVPTLGPKVYNRTYFGLFGAPGKEQNCTAGELRRVCRVGRRRPGSEETFGPYGSSPRCLSGFKGFKGLGFRGFRGLRV